MKPHEHLVLVPGMMCDERLWEAQLRALAPLCKEAPFPIRSMQVDGGSEFRDEFEQACRDLGIPRYVLPPEKPRYNGCVERANGTSRYEFYPFYEGPR